MSWLRCLDEPMSKLEAFSWTQLSLLNYQGSVAAGTWHHRQGIPIVF